MIKVSTRVVIELELDTDDAKKLYKDLIRDPKVSQVTKDFADCLYNVVYPAVGG